MLLNKYINASLSAIAYYLPLLSKHFFSYAGGTCNNVLTNLAHIPFL